MLTAKHLTALANGGMNKQQKPDRRQRRALALSRAVHRSLESLEARTLLSAPTQTLGALANVQAAGGTAYEFTLTYADAAHEVSLGTLGDTNLDVVRVSDGSHLSAILVGVNRVRNSPSITATYEIAPPRRHLGRGRQLRLPDPLHRRGHRRD